MKISIILFLSFWILTSCRTTFYEVEKHPNNTLITKRGKIESVIFSKDAVCLFCNLGVSRFTPTLEEINQAEIILQKNIKTANYPIYNQGDGCPFIHRNLKNYRRQYYGFKDSAGNQILFVNFLWARYTIFDRLKGYFKDESLEWKEEYVQVLDGCSHYWQININLSQQKLENLSINGPA